jgi:hypothetical protein
LDNIMTSFTRNIADLGSALEHMHATISNVGYGLTHLTCTEVESICAVLEAAAFDCTDIRMGHAEEDRDCGNEHHGWWIMLQADQGDERALEELNECGCDEGKRMAAVLRNKLEVASGRIRTLTDPHNALRHHVTGAVERGEAEPIVAMPYPKEQVTLDSMARGLETGD